MINNYILRKIIDDSIESYFNHFTFEDFKKLNNVEYYIHGFIYDFLKKYTYLAESELYNEILNHTVKYEYDYSEEFSTSDVTIYFKNVTINLKIDFKNQKIIYKID